MFAIAIWQWGVELVFVFIYFLQINFINGKSMFVDSLFANFIYFTSTLINAFYLFGDNNFQQNGSKFGWAKAVFLAIVQYP